MPKKESKEFTYNIDAYIGTIKESDKHDWTKAVLRMTWGDNPPSLDIRSVNMTQKRVGKGISLSNEDADRLVNILLENDYGTLEELEAAVKRKREVFSITKDIEDVLIDDEPLIIDIK